MSETGCLVSSCFSTVTVHNEIIAPNVSIATYHEVDDTITINESGDQQSDTKPKSIVGTGTSTVDFIDLSNPANVKIDTQKIVQPPTSILKNMYLVVTDNNFLVSAAAGVTSLRIGISTDDGENTTEVFEKSPTDPTIDIVSGASSGGNNDGSIIAMNTVIPLLINYSYARDKDIQDSIAKQGYFGTTAAETLKVAIDGGVPAAGKGSLYNKEVTSRNLYITLSSSVDTEAHLLLGARTGPDGAMSSGGHEINNGVIIDPSGTAGIVIFEIICDFQLIKNI